MLLFYLIIVFIMAYSIILHELAHAKVAELMGDRTARMFGRLTLNPLPHIDLFGTILLPLLLLLSGSPVVFGMAKPVPINPYNFHDYRKGLIYVSAAGIIVNLLLAWILATLVKFIPLVDNPFVMVIQQSLVFGVQINLVLAVFNLIPIPPLDGSKLFSMLLPYKYAQYINRLEPYGIFILLFILIFPPAQALFWWTVETLCNIMLFRF